MHPTSLYLIVCLAYNDERTRLNNAANTAMYMQDTCTGFLLGGVGEMNAKRQPNFLVVTKGT